MTPPKGVTNNPNGRPPVDEPRVVLSARVMPKTKMKIEREADRQETSIGLVIDKLAKKLP